MAGSYIRKFSPNKFHIISAVFAVISVLLLVSGAHRAFRVIGSLDSDKLTSEIDVHENDSIILHDISPVRVRLKEAEHDMEISCGTEQNQKYEIFVINLFGYRYAAVKIGTDEYDKLLGGEEITGCFSYKYSDHFRDRITTMPQYFDPDTVIPESECSDLGIIIVDREKELLSFLWFFPFLTAALILLKIGGSPYFYFPEEE